jgi:hypothetical protein
MLGILVAGEDTLGGVMYTYPEYKLVVMATVMQVTSSVCSSFNGGATVIRKLWSNTSFIEKLSFFSPDATHGHVC